jgi:hypothetical protein
MRGITLDLPAGAKDRLDNLNLERNAELDAANSAQSRLNNLPDDADPRLRDRLTQTRDTHVARQMTLHRLLSSVNQTLFELRLAPGQFLEPVKASVSLKKGETAVEALVAVRQQITVLTAQLAAARRAPLKKLNMREALTRRLAAMALRARPRINFDQQGNVNITWGEDIATMDSVLGLLALCFPQELAAAFEFDDTPDPPNALSVAERDAAVAKIGADLLAQERIEAVLLEQCDGTLPRPEMSPLAFLQLTISSELTNAAHAA